MTASSRSMYVRPADWIAVVGDVSPNELIGRLAHMAIHQHKAIKEMPCTALRPSLYRHSPVKKKKKKKREREKKGSE